MDYQTFIWKLACVPVLNLPSPIGNGWQMEDGKICEDLILNSSVPHAIVELTGANAKGTVKQIYNPANVPI